MPVDAYYFYQPNLEIPARHVYKPEATPETSLMIPMDPGNRHYQEFLAWRERNPNVDIQTIHALNQI